MVFLGKYQSSKQKKKLWSFHYYHMKNFCCLFAFFVDKTNKILHIIRSLQNHFFQRKHCSKKNNYLDCTLDWEKSWIIITLMINIQSVLLNSLNCIKSFRTPCFNPNPKTLLKSKNLMNPIDFSKVKTKFSDQCCQNYLLQL